MIDEVRNRANWKNDYSIFDLEGIEGLDRGIFFFLFEILKTDISKRTVLQFARVQLIRRLRARAYQLVRVRLALVALDIARGLLLSLLSPSRRDALHALRRFKIPRDADIFDDDLRRPALDPNARYLLLDISINLPPILTLNLDNYASSDEN